MIGEDGGEEYEVYVKELRDPFLDSVFTVPKIDFSTESLWYANVPDIPDFYDRTYQDRSHSI